MRVIAGKARGHKLIAPQGLITRPTGDRVKESIFNIIQDKLYNSIIIDLFSGSGNLGIEALSRNADKAYFIDNSKESIKLIKQNLDKTNLKEYSEVINMDVYSAMKKLSSKNIKADIIFIDPPYSKDFIEPVLNKINFFGLLHNDGIIILEHDKNDLVPNRIDDLEKYRTNLYGDTIISFYHIHNGGDINGNCDLSR